MMRKLVAAAVSVTFFGCNLCTEVETFYRGTRSGTLVIVEEGPNSGMQIATRSGPWDDRDTFSASRACRPALPAPAPGQVVIAWLSPDDAATVTARCMPADAGVFDGRPAACAPGAMDPQGRKDFELPAYGSVVSQIELLDP